MLHLLVAASLITLTPKSIVNRPQNTQQEGESKTGNVGIKDWPNRVYLATYPRSGNHWMRYLLEEVTGIATSSVYKDIDPPHMTRIFPWGGYCCEHGYEGNARYPVKGEIVVVKTHYPAIKTQFDELPHLRSIRIIRHPIDSFYSSYLYEKKCINKEPDFFFPKRRIIPYIQAWREFQDYWDEKENVLSIRYEDLYINPAYYLKLALEHIGYPFTQDDIDRAVAKYPPTGGILKHLNHFTRDDLTLIQEKLSDVLERYGYPPIDPN